MTIEIEKDIPLPKPIDRSRGEDKDSEEVARMTVGDSFLIKGKDTRQSSHLIQKWKKMTGFTFTCRTFADGTRVWRLS